MIRLRRDRAQNYYYLFDHETGIAVRWGKDNREPFWREEGPELLDISITSYCEKECEFCYRKANRNGYFMEFSLYEEIMEQAEKAGVQQIALGGGNPNQHPEFWRFLKTAMTFEKCKIGFDSCMISWLVKHREFIAEESVDYCEAGRFSAFISERGLVYPCSFLSGDESAGDFIRERSLTEIWKNSMVFNDMRERLMAPTRQKAPISRCMNCVDYPLCHGGCQIFPINRCR